MDIDNLINNIKLECNLIFEERKILLEFETNFDLYKLSKFCIYKHNIIYNNNELFKNNKINNIDLDKID